MFGNHSRPIYIWGAGSCGITTFKDIEKKCNVQGFIDSNSEKWGSILENKQIFPPQILKDSAQKESPFVVIASTWVDEIERELHSFDFKKDKDYVLYTELGYCGDNWLEQYSRFIEICNNSYAPLSLQDFKEFDDEFWYWMNTKGYRENEVLQRLLSPLPEDKYQIRLTGVTGDVSLRHAFNQYVIMKGLLERNHIKIVDLKRILDFGCGYGRLLRFFAKDGVKSELIGTDIDRELIGFCRESNKFGSYFLNEAWPPLVFEDHSFDFVFAFSVFTHISEKSHLSWMEEINRVLKPGGALIFTIWAHPSKTRDYHDPHFEDYGKLIERYENGEFCYSNRLYNGSDTYGEALYQRSYIKEKWSKYFEILDYTESHPNSPSQNHILLRKK
ncbi:MAG: class I SAM-dependent methyltransferase [Clostridia bacterium]|nr:class I SAM-dependent methyltransferase [Clostridia bacterium]